MVQCYIQQKEPISQLENFTVQVMILETFHNLVLYNSSEFGIDFSKIVLQVKQMPHFHNLLTNWS